MGRVRRIALGISLRGPRVSWAELTTRLGWVRVLRSGTLDGETVPERPPWRRPDRVVVGLPRRSVVFRWLERPDVDNGHLAGLLAYEVEEHVPFPADEVAYDFQKMRRRGSRAEVLLVGTRKDDVTRALEQVARLGIDAPTAVDVTSLAAVNGLLFRKRTRPGEITCFVEIDGGEAEVSAVRDGTLVSSRALALEDDATPVLVDELRRVLATSPPHSARVFTSGAGDELCARIGAALGVATEAWSPGPSGVDPAAFGLALRGLRKVPLHIDLLPAERRKTTRERALTLTVALMALVGLLAAAVGLGAAHREWRALSDVTGRLTEAKARVAEIERLKAEVQRLTSRVQFLDQARRERELPLRALRELARVLPDDAALSELVSDWPRVQIRGSTASSPSGLISAFEQSTAFENAAFTSPIAAQGDRQGFQIRVSLKAR